MTSEMSSVFRIKGIFLFSTDLEFEEIIQIEENKNQILVMSNIFPASFTVTSS